jgi:hypothetical protein
VKIQPNAANLLDTKLFTPFTAAVSVRSGAVAPWSVKPDAGVVAQVLKGARVESSAISLRTAKLDTMSEVSETMSLKLQMTTDRLSKLSSTLSNLLKKLNDTGNQITQNLK